MVFTLPSQLPYKDGDLFLGLDENGNEVGFPSDRHAITIAGSRSGKGACTIIPNLKRCPYNALVIDPKGENAKETWKDRMDMGQAVHVIDPFGKTGLPDQILGAFNPLDHIDKDSLTAGSDLLVIADGLIKKSNPDHAEWDATAAKILAGCMGYVLAEAPEGKKTITEARSVLLQASDDLRDDALNMMLSEEFDGIVSDAGNMIVTALDSEKSLESQALSQAKRQTQWIGMRAFRNVLETSTFKLSDLKTGKATVYLVLPPEYLAEHGAFLKMFVQSAINAMLQGGANSDTRCLFFLDEFYSLGRMDLIMKGFGLLAGYGVQLWPILQDIGQLVETYGQEGMGPFFGNSDLHQFFGNSDPLTLQHISMTIGATGVDEVYLPNAPDAPMGGNNIGGMISGMAGASRMGSARVLGGTIGGLTSLGESISQGSQQANYQNQMQAYQQQMQQAMSKVGQMRFPPEKVAKAVQKKRGEAVAPNSINFITGIGTVMVPTAPYFVPVPTPTSEQEQPSTDEELKVESVTIWGTTFSDGEFFQSHFSRFLVFAVIGIFLGTVMHFLLGMFATFFDALGIMFLITIVGGFWIFRVKTGSWEE